MPHSVYYSHNMIYIIVNRNNRCVVFVVLLIQVILIICRCRSSGSRNYNANQERHLPSSSISYPQSLKLLCRILKRSNLLASLFPFSAFRCSFLLRFKKRSVKSVVIGMSELPKGFTIRSSQVDDTEEIYELMKVSYFSYVQEGILEEFLVYTDFLYHVQT